MPFETSPYLLIADGFVGMIPDLTVIKLLGFFGFVWAALRIASGERFGILASGQAKLFLLFYAGVIFVGSP